jgi:hypothetical protein
VETDGKGPGAASEPDFKLVHTANGEMEAQGLRSVLEAAGIPVVLRFEAAARYYPVTIDGLGAVKLMVPADRLEEAKAILETPAETVEEDEDAGGQQTT